MSSYRSGSCQNCGHTPKRGSGLHIKEFKCNKCGKYFCQMCGKGGCPSCGSRSYFNVKYIQN